MEIIDFHSAPPIHLASAKRLYLLECTQEHKYMYMGNTNQILQNKKCLLKGKSNYVLSLLLTSFYALIRPTVTALNSKWARL